LVLLKGVGVRRLRAQLPRRRDVARWRNRAVVEEQYSFTAPALISIQHVVTLAARMRLVGYNCHIAAREKYVIIKCTL
jgi:hypothetical protein